jgi:hypothetical protein
MEELMGGDPPSRNPDGSWKLHYRAASPIPQRGQPKSRKEEETTHVLVYEGRNFKEACAAAREFLLKRHHRKRVVEVDSGVPDAYRQVAVIDTILGFRFTVDLHMEPSPHASDYSRPAPGLDAPKGHVAQRCRFCDAHVFFRRSRTVP